MGIVITATLSRGLRHAAIMALAGAALLGTLALANSDAAAPRYRNEPIRPLPLSTSTDARRTELGRRLFSDPLLSADGSVSCATCHLLAQGGADRSA
ncbi:MAG: cytochrome c peroxidase, partial [Panacagrimonas sp.]